MFHFYFFQFSKILKKTIDKKRKATIYVYEDCEGKTKKEKKKAKLKCKCGGELYHYLFLLNKLAN